jgi:hypothetical protein
MVALPHWLRWRNGPGRFVPLDRLGTMSGPLALLGMLRKDAPFLGQVEVLGSSGRDRRRGPAT